MSKAPEILAFPNSELLDWYGQVKRELPWRDTRDPYLVWVSEIILQQTRVDQGLPYYRRFVERFPTVASLAEASEDDVLKHWEGLGYYSRARNLHATAHFIHAELSGKFPDTHDGLLSLKGVGPYTAAAIGSIVFGLPVAAVDGNVYRVLARYFAIMESIDDTRTKKQIESLANAILAKDAPGDHNQAVMELGATVCTPQNPNCRECPIASSCTANAKALQSTLPLRSKRTKVRDRFFHYVVRICGDEVFIAKRGSGDIWQGLYEFPLFESQKRLQTHELLAEMHLHEKDVLVSISEEYRHILSHQRIFARFLMVRTDRFEDDEFIRVKIAELPKFAFPKLIGHYLSRSGLVIHGNI